MRPGSTLEAAPTLTLTTAAKIYQWTCIIFCICIQSCKMMCLAVSKLGPSNVSTVASAPLYTLCFPWVVSLLYYIIIFLWYHVFNLQLWGSIISFIILYILPIHTFYLYVSYTKPILLVEPINPLFWFFDFDNINWSDIL